MSKIGRNDPCPCGSGKKFKNCHFGRETELALIQMESLPEGAAEKITGLPEVDYGRCREMLSGLNLERLTGTKVGLKFIDLEAYLRLGFSSKPAPKNLAETSAGQMINPLKTMPADPKHIYLAVTPAVSDSTLIHQMAHALDYLAGSQINPGLAGPLSLEVDLPLELLEHPREFGDWLEFLRNEFGVTLDAEDAIVSFLHQHGHLIPGEIIAADNHERLESLGKASLKFLMEKREEIDRLIRDRDGYLENQAPKPAG